MNLADLDLNDVATFVQVVRSGSFAEAARRKGVPPNTISRRIQHLESRLGSRLLQRSTRKLSLTGAGQALHDRCAAAVDELLQAGQDLAGGSAQARGTVRVAAPADLFEFFPMEWVADFLARLPEVRVEFVLSDSSADLIAERIDVALRGGSLTDSGYVARQLIPPRDGGLVASPAYLASRGTPRALADLASHDCVTAPHPSGRTTWRLGTQGGAVHDVQVSGRFSGNTAQALRKATLAGLGIALLPTRLAQLDIEAGRLRPVLPQYVHAGQGLSVLYPSRRHLPLAVSAFIDLVVEKLGDTQAVPPAFRTHRT